MHFDPKATEVNGKYVIWPKRVRELWNERVVPRFKEGEHCSSANYFTPRLQDGEWIHANPHEGFCYVVQPGNNVAIAQWIPEPVAVR